MLNVLEGGSKVIKGGFPVIVIITFAGVDAGST